MKHHYRRHEPGPVDDDSIVPLVVIVYMAFVAVVAWALNNLGVLRALLTGAQ